MGPPQTRLKGTRQSEKGEKTTVAAHRPSVKGKLQRARVRGPPEGVIAILPAKPYIDSSNPARSRTSPAHQPCAADQPPPVGQRGDTACTVRRANSAQWVHRLAATRCQEAHMYFMHEPTAPGNATTLLRLDAPLKQGTQCLRDRSPRGNVCSGARREFQQSHPQ